MSERGKFIVLYGPNNIGKTTASQNVVTYLNEHGHKTVYLKYPIYDLEPTGPEINAVLRNGKEMDSLELQKLFAQNRRDFEPQLKEILNDGTYIVAEDYKGTGIAWGMVAGISLTKMEEINKDLLEPDVCVLMDGTRFLEAAEKGHRHEGSEEMWWMARDIHLTLGARYGWQIVCSNQPEGAVKAEILDAVLPIIEGKEGRIKRER